MMTTVVDFAVGLLVLNAMWDLLSACIILADFAFGSRLSVHMALWAEPEDRENRAAMLLTAGLVFQWGCVRLLACEDFEARWPDAAFTYWLEGALVGLCTSTGRMHIGRGSVVVFLCFCCWEALVVAGLEGAE